ncbi:GNAT family N-acetyltransferase [Vibrio aphrogenes]|uniref:GNAT family N-acetyltransferase n=1 Tax=Vibrio aphrogenes TaxID=1891186 RepID=UPI000B359E17|nr:GNAT family N-acetyltransferase [Vibrio aphrogenes]
MLALNSLNDLANRLRYLNHRYAIELTLEPMLSTRLLSEFVHCQQISNNEVVWLGGEQTLLPSVHYGYKQGQQLLGQEIKILIVDFSCGFDANSFNAALGALCGGSILFFIHLNALANDYAGQWIKRHVHCWPQIRSLDSPLELDEAAVQALHLEPALELQPFVEQADTQASFSQQVSPPEPAESQHSFSQQQIAVQAIEKVLTGHRRRPLVINANRGRGKTSSLGIAAAKLMVERRISIIVTAPSVKSLSPLFTFLAQAGEGDSEITWLSQQANHWTLSNGSQLRFIAPDELLLSEVPADLVLVDEAAALPLPMLIQFVERYHRLVLSSTIHGYEGCGRGFTLKFLPWLDAHRPGWKLQSLTQPIRWAEFDPLEAWCFASFLLDADAHAQAPWSDGELTAQLPTLTDNVRLQRIAKSQLVDDPKLFTELFGTLVLAHYQTSPNDLLQVLATDEIEVFAIIHSGSQPHHLKILGCILTCREGQLSLPLISDIQKGKRRPKGHLAAAYLANHLAIDEPALQASIRVMRIAVHPSLHRHGIGVKALEELADCVRNEFDFISVSFGATAELIGFWQSQFHLVSLGTRRDQSSGCYSAFMVQPLSESAQYWVERAHHHWAQQFQIALPFLYQQIQADTLAHLLFASSTAKVVSLPRVLCHYAHGGNSFETALVTFQQFVFQYLQQSSSKDLTLGRMTLSPELRVVIDKVLLVQTWQEVAHKHQLTGRKQIEQTLKDWLVQFTV